METRRTMRASVGVLLLLALLAPFVVRPAAASSSSSDQVWQSFTSDRPKLFEKLAPAFTSCFQRRDSLIDPLSPIFHGCLDWHSAVHAAYSHHVVYRRTDQQRYLDLVESKIAPAGVSLVPAEYAYEVAKGQDLPLTENPYGFGWFLVLAREREESTGNKDLREMAAYAAEQMVAWFEQRASRGDPQQFILNRAHPNYSWSLINLDMWARYTKDKQLLSATRKAAKPLLDSSLDGLCPVKSDTEPNATGFQPACLMRLVAVAQVQGDGARRWVEARLPKDLSIPPVTEPVNCHAGGLNFTRAFALYQLYRLTGDRSYRDNYVKLIRYHVGRPDLYIDESYLGDPGYLCYSHWVAQVGVRAISLSYER